jgi:hypothetical protein
MVEGDTSGDDVAPGIAWLELDSMLVPQGIDRLELEQGELAIRPRLIGVEAGPAELTIALDASTRNRRDGRHLSHGLGRFAADVK